ncbi:hypothetical protein [Parendozoicomonas sp. Alg238-R29]|uniref:hypothetical protein n=1 Tax=Parendozoicomonas sp. Alg238-R29 TaxID=2993446 RepID=UPI00248E5549|nr:hypothetical protein [Parendozoicomonas sp. Alg238-R29]
MGVESARQAFASRKEHNWSVPKALLETVKALFAGHKVVSPSTDQVRYTPDVNRGNVNFESLKNRQVSSDEFIESSYISVGSSEVTDIPNDMLNSDAVHYRVNRDQPHAGQQIGLGVRAEGAGSDRLAPREPEDDGYVRAVFDPSVLIDLVIGLSERDSVSDEMVAQTFGIYVRENRLTESQVKSVLDELGKSDKIPDELGPLLENSSQGALKLSPYYQLAVDLLDQLYFQHQGDEDGFSDEVKYLYSYEDKLMQTLSEKCTGSIADNKLLLDGESVGWVKEAISHAARKDMDLSKLDMILPLTELYKAIEEKHRS